MVCKFCGNEIEDGSDFCFICGQKVDSSAEDNNVADVYSQPEASEAPAAEAQPVSAQTDVYQAAPAQTVTAQPVAEAAPAAVAPEAPAKGKKAKKAKKPKTQYQTKKGIRFVAFLFAIIGYILYCKAKKAGNEVRATEIANAILLGLDIKLAIVSVILIKKWMLS